MSEPRIETFEETDQACAVLTAAFATDPGVQGIFGDDHRSLRCLYDLVVPPMLRNPHSVLLGIRDDEGLASVAVCQGPGKEPPLLPMLIRGAPLMWRLGLRRVRKVLQFDRALREHSPLSTEWLRLAMLGTRPDVFGRGYGAALLRAIDDHARKEGLPSIYLEADAKGYPRRLYDRHGYRVTKEFETIAGPAIVMVKQLEGN